MKNIISEIKNTLEGINSRLNESEEWISEFEDKVVDNTQLEKQKQQRI